MQSFLGEGGWGGANFILRVKEQETRLTLQEHDDDDDDDNNNDEESWIQKKWLQHVQRMDTNRIPKQALRCRPKGRRNIGRPKKRWTNQLHFEDQGTGNTTNSSGT